MLSECSLAGILEIDFDAISFHIGAKITEKDLDFFNDRIVFLTENKIFIKSFVVFQQKEINANNPAHKNIIKELERYGIGESLDTGHLERPFEDPSKPLLRGTSNSKGNGKGNSNYNIYNNISDTENKGVCKPDDVSDQVWKDFVAHRKAKKAPITQTALNSIKKEAEKARWPLERALSECCARGWQSFKADWVSEQTGKQKSNYTGRSRNAELMKQGEANVI